MTATFWFLVFFFGATQNSPGRQLEYSGAFNTKEECLQARDSIIRIANSNDLPDLRNAICVAKEVSTND